MEIIKAKMLTAKTKAEYNGEPLQLPEEPKRLKLDNTELITMASTKYKVVPPFGKTESRVPYPPTKMTMVEPREPPNMPEVPKRTNMELKLDQAKNIVNM